MPFPSVTYTFTNGTTADASQVNQNFTDIINGISDTTKNISVSAGTFAGTLTASANTILGSSSANTITFNASVSSSVPVGTNTTYDLGSSTLGFRSLYIGGTSTFTTRLVGGTQSGSLTLTLPTAAAAFTQYVLTADTAGVMSWTSRNAQQLSTKTASSYSIVGSDDVIIADATSNSVTITLPAPASFTGRIFRVMRFDATFTVANTVTIARNASEKINGTAGNLVLMTQGETLALATNGTDWFMVDHNANTNWTTYTMTIAGTTSNPTKGTTAYDQAYWRRVGDSMEIRFEYSQTAAGSAGSGSYLFALPTGFTINTSKIQESAVADSGSAAGKFVAFDGTTSFYGVARPNLTNNTSFSLSDSTGVVGSSHVALSNTTVRFGVIIFLPITNWFA